MSDQIGNADRHSHLELNARRIKGSQFPGGLLGVEIRTGFDDTQFDVRGTVTRLDNMLKQGYEATPVRGAWVTNRTERYTMAAIALSAPTEGYDVAEKALLELSFGLNPTTPTVAIQPQPVPDGTQLVTSGQPYRIEIGKGRASRARPRQDSGLIITPGTGNLNEVLACLSDDRGNAPPFILKSVATVEAMEEPPGNAVGLSSERAVLFGVREDVDASVLGRYIGELIDPFERHGSTVEVHNQ